MRRIQRDQLPGKPLQVCAMLRTSFNAAEGWQRGLVLFGEMRELRLLSNAKQC